jgi:Ni/Co efflux regulator RcnB
MQGGALFEADPHRIAFSKTGENQMKKLLVTLIASAFAVTAFAQAPKSDTAPKAPAATAAKKDATPAPKADAKPAKGEKKAKSEKKSKGKGKAKSDEAKK